MPIQFLVEIERAGIGVILAPHRIVYEADATRVNLGWAWCSTARGKIIDVVVIRDELCPIIRRHASYIDHVTIIILKPV